MSYKLIAVAAAALMLSACAMTTQECDPTLDPGFLDKIGCTISGSYAQRVEDKEANLRALQSENERLVKLQQLLSNEEALISDSKAIRQAQYQKIQAQVADLKQALAEDQKLNDSLRTQLNQLETQSAELAQMPEEASILERQQRLAELQETAAALGI